ncbi:MAG TPA: tRNA (adenosine(37)-N6)-threonylcarbamoyltransferase complex ATPase subunit type 1 TsaE [Candidatus Omnitrophota bacterium]|nr:tRNA (adenosine(37)-N6)-threonylcarbamoyltransferase complex ATPase subunit type 1 TsaE [Candidatus Omnitrophota bacterium]
MLKLRTRSADETKRIGSRIGKILKAGDVVTLEGGLGAGKTTMVKGLARGLGVKSDKKVLSPTFVLVHEYPGREKVFHIDWYRLKEVSGADAHLAEECFGSQGVTLVEWPERGRDLLPKEALKIRVAHQGGDKRLIQISAKSGRGLEILGKIKP